MVENSGFLNRLRNVHLEKSVATGICRVQRSPKTAKTPAKVHLRLRFQNPGKPRTAGLCGRAAGACDCGPLSCAKIERPSPLKKPSCKVRFFANRHFRNYRQKVTATTLFQTASYSDFQLLAQMAHVCFHRRKRVHTRLSDKDGTQRLTRRNRGHFGWGWYHYPRSVPHVSETLRGRGLKRQTLPLLGLGRGYSRRTQNGNVKKCAVGKHPKSEKLGGIGSGCRLRLHPLPVPRRRQPKRVACIDPDAVVVDKNIAKNDRFDLFSR